MDQNCLDQSLTTRKTRKKDLLFQIDRGVPWAAVVYLIDPYYPKDKHGRQPLVLDILLRIHCLQQRFTLSDMAMEEGLFNLLICQQFFGLDGCKNYVNGQKRERSNIKFE